MIQPASEAVKTIKSGDNVFIHSAAAIPQYLVDAMTARNEELRNVNIYQIHTEGRSPYAYPNLEDSFTIKPFFVGANVRSAVQNGSGSYIPVFLSEVPRCSEKK